MIEFKFSYLGSHSSFTYIRSRTTITELTQIFYPWKIRACAVSLLSIFLRQGYRSLCCVDWLMRQFYQSLPWWLPLVIMKLELHLLSKWIISIQYLRLSPETVNIQCIQFWCRISREKGPSRQGSNESLPTHQNRLS